MENKYWCYSDHCTMKASPVWQYNYCVRVHKTFDNILFHLVTKAVPVHHDKFITNNK